MTGFGLIVPRLVLLGQSRLFVQLEHFVCITVVGSDESHAAQSVDNRQYAAELYVKSLH